MIKVSTLVAYLILLFPCAFLVTVNASGVLATIASYYDEIIGLAALIYVTVVFMQKKLTTADNMTYVGLVILTVFGVVSNLFSGVTRNVFAVLVDVVFLWKPIACFLAFKCYAAGRKTGMLRALYPWAKLSIVLNLILSVLGQFVRIGVTIGGANWYGKTYVFFWSSPYQTAWLVVGSLLIVAAATTDARVFKRYFLMAIPPLFFVGAALVWGWLIIAVMLLAMIREGKAFKKGYLVWIALVLLAAFSTDVAEYLLNDSAPRAKLLRGALEVANRYFPFGSGFATYGSEMASRYYSSIYRDFGWQNSWGLGMVFNQYINDNFFACITGQFGWLGLVLYIGIQMNILGTVSSPSMSRMSRAMAVATILTLVASMIGSASCKSVMGVCLFSILGLLSADNKQVPMFLRKTA